MNDSKTFWAVLIVIITAGVFYYLFLMKPAGPEAVKPELPPTPVKSNMHKITIETSKGIIRFETYDGDSPKTVENFVNLANKGYYNGLIFHRIIPGFMIQGGDPYCKPKSTDDTGICGTGGPGYKFADELDPGTESYQAGYRKGVVAMANSGPNTNGSQFFIMHVDDTNRMPKDYTIFGKVVEGQDVVDAITRVKTNSSNRPVDAVIMKKVTVE